jgi:hypothetical protein
MQHDAAHCCGELSAAPAVLPTAPLASPAATPIPAATASSTFPFTSPVKGSIRGLNDRFFRYPVRVRSTSGCQLRTMSRSVLSGSASGRLYLAFCFLKAEYTSLSWQRPLRSSCTSANLAAAGRGHSVMSACLPVSACQLGLVAPLMRQTCQCAGSNIDTSGITLAHHRLLFLTASSQQPAASSQQPAASSQQPAASSPAL